MTRTADWWESAAKGHEAEAILYRVLGQKDLERDHLLAARSLAEEARIDRALTTTTSRAASEEEIRHSGHMVAIPGCGLCP